MTAIPLDVLHPGLVTDEDAVLDPGVTCDGCGACCTHRGTPPGSALFHPVTGEVPDSDKAGNPDSERWLAMPAELRAGLKAYSDAVRAGATEDRTRDGQTPCLWFDGAARRCLHHEHRPEVCREFAVGAVGCLRQRREAGLR